MNDFTFTARGFADYVYWQGQDRKTLAKINRLLASVRRTARQAVWVSWKL